MLIFHGLIWLNHQSGTWNCKVSMFCGKWTSIPRTYKVQKIQWQRIGRKSEAIRIFFLATGYPRFKYPGLNSRLVWRCPFKIAAQFLIIYCVTICSQVWLDIYQSSHTYDLPKSESVDSCHSSSNLPNLIHIHCTHKNQNHLSTLTNCTTISLTPLFAKSRYV